MNDKIGVYRSTHQTAPGWRSLRAPTMTTPAQGHRSHGPIHGPDRLLDSVSPPQRRAPGMTAPDGKDHALCPAIPEQWLDTIHQSDCVTLMRALPKESIKTIVTSPPYNLRNTTGGGLLRNGGAFSKGRKIRNGYQAHDDAMPHDAYVAWQRECLTEMMRVLRPDGVIFYNHKWRLQNLWLQDGSDIVSGFPLRQIIIWRRNGGINFESVTGR